MGLFYSKECRTDQFYNWRPDESDSGDEYRQYKSKKVSGNLKRVVDNSHHCGPVFNQDKLGSCTANAIAGAYSYRYNLEYGTSAGSEDEFVPSRLFIYYNERNMEGTTKTDSGAQIKDGIASVSTNGVCPESMWPYDETKFAERPSDECYTEAKSSHRAIKRHRVMKTLDSLKGCLETGRVFVFGFVVFESFEDQYKWRDNVMPMPEENEKVLGGHAVLCVGYDDFKGCFKVRNSWGSEWGDEGNFYMPYEFMVGTFNLSKCDRNKTYWDELHDSKLQVFDEEDYSDDEEEIEDTFYCGEVSDADNEEETATDDEEDNDEPLCSDIWSIDMTFDKQE